MDICNELKSISAKKKTTKLITAIFRLRFIQRVAMYCVEMHYWTELKANLEMANDRSDSVRKQFQSAIRHNTEAFSCSVNHNHDCASVKQ